MKRLILFLSFALLFFKSSMLFCDLQQYEESEPVLGEAIIKFVYQIDSLEVQQINGHIEIGIPWFDSLSEYFGIYELERIFPGSHPVLSRIWKIKFPVEISVQNVTSAFSQVGEVDYSHENG